MSTDTPIKDALKIEGQNGQATYILPQYSEQLARESALDGLSKEVEPTPDPGPDDDDDRRPGGIVRRANEFRSRLGPLALESIALHGMETRKAIGRRSDELYLNKFPHLEPAFTRKCEECGAEFDQEVDVCNDCGAPTREPSQAQKARADSFFDSVNKEDQSLTELYKFLARDGGRLGVWLHVVKKRYGVVMGEVFEHPVELVRGDPKRIKPVVDENRRIGNHWWACPLHRDPDQLKDQPGQCELCGAELREVFYAEVENLGDDKPIKVYFGDEIVTHAPFEPRLAGLDGLSPVDGIWLKQAILWWMDLYAAGFYDQNNTNRYPGKLVLVHTSNKGAFEKQLDQAQDEQDEDPYAQGIIYNEVPPGMDQSADKAQVLDMMSDQLRGQSGEIKKDYKSDIRSVFGQTDAQDSELEDAGGLNNEGLQLEINDRDKAAAHQELRTGPLDKLMRVLGFDDWEITFIPPQREEEELTALEKIRAVSEAKKSGVGYQVEDGRVEILDTDGPVESEAPASTDDQVEASAASEDGVELVQKAGNWMTVNEGRAELGLPPIEGPKGDDFGAPGRVGALDTGGEGESVGEALESLEAMHRQFVWGHDTDSLEQEAEEPFWNRDEDMPEFVQQLIEEALNADAIFQGDYEAPGVSADSIEAFFREKLDQPQGWSLDSLASDFADRFDLSFDKAMEVLRPQLTNVLNTARAEGYSQQGNLDERQFKWIGPDDDNNTRACEWMREQTNPDYGGDPVTLDRLEELVEEANDRFVPSHDNREWTPHINCRHTYVEHFD